MLAFLETFFGKTYELFNSINVPGFNISIMSVMLGAFGALVSISLLKMFFGLGNSGVSGGSRFFFTHSSGSFKQNGGNNTSIVISEQRRGDTH